MTVLGRSLKKIMLSETAEAQFAALSSIVGDSSVKIRDSEWDELDPKVGSIFPTWYRNLLERHALAEVVYDIDTEAIQIFGITLATPKYFQGSLEELLSLAWDFPILYDSEYFPLGLTENGETYVAKRKLPTAVYEFLPQSDGKGGFKPGVHRDPQWKDISDFAGELIPEGYDD